MLIFFIRAQFCDISLRCSKTKHWENSKWTLPIHLTSKSKIKGTLFSSIFKVREHKVSSFFWIISQMGFGYFELSQSLVFKRLRVKSQNGYRFLMWPHIKKIRTLSFLQLLKLKKIKCLFLRLEVRCMG